MTAFLLLSIVPLSLISFVASTQARRSLQKELEEKLDTIATLTESQIHNWVTSQQLTLVTLSSSLEVEPQNNNPASPPTDSSQLSSSASPDLRAKPAESESLPTSLTSQLGKSITEIQANNPALLALLLLNQQGQMLAVPTPIQDATGGHYADFTCLDEPLVSWSTSPQASSPLLQLCAYKSSGTDSRTLALTQSIAGSDLIMVALLDPQSLIQAIVPPTSWNGNGEIYLVLASGQALDLYPSTSNTDSTSPTNENEQANARRSTLDTDIERHSTAIKAALAGQSGVGDYGNYRDKNVIGAYRWLPELNMALLVEQTQDSALAASDDLAVVLIGAALAVALLTALIAAAVTRRITLPIIQLTATAVQIAAGDLSQKVPATRRDEIGILARAFNVMTTKLRVLYEGLEQKVKERTQQLQEANAEIRYRAMQLAISAEVGRVVTSILDRDTLLARVVELIRDCFQAYFVAIYFVDEKSQWATLQEGSGRLGQKLKARGYQVDLIQDSLISQVANSLKPCVRTGPALEHSAERALFPHTRAELLVPIKIGKRSIGVLDVHSTHKDAFAGDEIMVLETLAGQIAVAIENARAYEIERQAVEQLRELEEFRRRFLSNMSRELRMPLNNIIGFSRVILKGIDGPITERQQQDLNAIHESGQQLMALINDILDIAQIEAGEMELTMRPVDLAEIAHSVIPTAKALLEGRPVNLHYEITPSLPLILADHLRLRQVLVKLLSNAAKFTQEGEITLRAWSNEHQVLASVSDTGIGIPAQHREKVFKMFHQFVPSTSSLQGTGLGLTFCKEIITMHGGTIALESQKDTGTTFTIALPILQSENDKE